MKKKMMVLILAVLMLAPGVMMFGGGQRDAGVEQVTLTYFRWAMPDARTAVYRQHIAEFEAQNPGVKVEFSAVPWGEFVDSLTRFQMAGTLPDVFTVYDASIGTFHAMDSLMALDDMVEPAFRDAFYETHWNHTVIGDTTYGVVFRNGVHMLFYNKDMFRAAGLPEHIVENGPQTHSELIQAAVATTKAGQYGYGDGYGDEEGYHQWRSYVMAAGDNPIDMETHEGRMNQKAGVEALQLLVDLNTKYGAVPPGSLAKNSSLRNQEFVNGLVAMVQGGIWIEQQWRDGGAQFELGVTTMPYPDDGDGYQGASAAFVANAVASNTKHPELAVKLVKHLASYDFVNEFCQASGLLPPRRDVAEQDPYWSSGRIPQYIEATTAPNFGALPQHPRITDFSRIMQTAIEEAMMGTKTVQKALDDATAAWNRLR